MNYSKLPYQVAAFCLTSSIAMGDNVNWDGDSDLNFNNSTNWDGDVAPVDGDRARFFVSDPGGTVTVTAPITIGSLRVGDTGKDLGSSVVLDASSTLSITAPNPSIRVQSTSANPSSLTLSGTILLGNTDPFNGAGIRTGEFSSLLLNGATVTGNAGNRMTFFPFGDTTWSSSTLTAGQEIRISDGTVDIQGSNTVGTDLDLLAGGGVAFTPGGELGVSGDFGGDGVWVFDLAGHSGSTPTYIDAQTIDITNVDLNLSNISGGNAIILAEYDSLVGSQFASVSGLNGRSIDYNYQGSGLIAIVPEPSWTVPVLAAFLPLFGFRRRMK